MTKATTPFSVQEADESTGFLLWQVTMLWQRRIAAALRPQGLTQVQFALLASLLWLSKKEGLTSQAALARHAKLDIMMTSQVLRTLQAKGLVERKPHPGDTRAKLPVLTRKGRFCAFKAVPAVEKADANFFNAIGSQQTGFNKSLRALINPD